MKKEFNFKGAKRVGDRFKGKDVYVGCRQCSSNHSLISADPPQGDEMQQSEELIAKFLKSWSSTGARFRGSEAGFQFQ